MSDAYPGFICHEGFFASDPDATICKLVDFREAAWRGEVMLATDADDTLTEPGYTSFSALDKHVASNDPEYEAENDRFYAAHKAGLLTSEEYLAWWELSFNRYDTAGIHLPTVLDEVGEYRLRPGVERLFTVADAIEMPTVVVSAGVKQPIERMLATHGIRPTLIVANNVYTDDEGYINGHDGANLIHLGNKSLHAHGNGRLASLRDLHPYAVALGDSPDDAGIVSGDDSKILRILVNNPDLDPVMLAERLQHFDLVARDAGMLCTAEVISWIGSGSNRSSRTHPPIYTA